MNEMSKRELEAEIEKTNETVEYTAMAPLVFKDEYQPASTRQFLSDFFRTDIMNHCEFLKRMNTFQGDDCYLISEICNRLVDQTKGKEAQKITSFYGGDDDEVNAADVGKNLRVFVCYSHFCFTCRSLSLTTFPAAFETWFRLKIGHIARADFQKHKSFPRNCFNIMMVYEALKGLDGHNYNIYELGE